MTEASKVVVLFDQISVPEFFRRLVWPFLVKAGSKAIGSRQVAQHKVELDLDGLDKS